MSGADAPLIFLTALGLGGGALLAGAEAAVTALPEARVRALHDESEGWQKRAFARFLADPTAVLARWLTLRVLCITASTALAAHQLDTQNHPSWWLVALIAVNSLVYAALAQLARTAGRERSRRLAPFALNVLRAFEWFSAPLSWPVLALTRAVQRAFATRNSEEPPQMTEREVEYVVEQAENAGALDAKRGEILQNVLELSDRTARDLMIPRPRINAIDASLPLRRAARLVADEGHSRVPVYEGTIDNITGILHVKDLYRALARLQREGTKTEPSVGQIARRPVMMIADNQSVLTVLREMQSRRSHMAMVIDEFGSLAGLLTLEDVLEELVGEIQDEHDEHEEAHVSEQEDGRLLAAGTAALDDLAEKLGVEFSEDEPYSTLNGFLSDHMGRVPEAGATLTWQGWLFTVREAEERRVLRVEIVRAAPPTAPPPAAPAES